MKSHNACLHTANTQDRKTDLPQLMPPLMIHLSSSQQLPLQCIKEAGCTIHVGAHAYGGGQSK